MSIQIGIIGGSGLYDMAELTDREETTDRDAVRRAVRAVRRRHAARQARRVPGAARRRPPDPAVRAELPRQHLRLQDAGRRAHPLGERGRQPQAGIQAARHRRSRPVLRSDAAGASARSSAAAWWRTSPSRTRSAPICSTIAARLAAAGRRRHGPPAAAPTSAWKGRSSRRWRSRSCIGRWGMDVIGMTNLQEAKLAREAEICYATIALVTDYDCWHPDHDRSPSR